MHLNIVTLWRASCDLYSAVRDEPKTSSIIRVWTYIPLAYKGGNIHLSKDCCAKSLGTRRDEPPVCCQ